MSTLRITLCLLVLLWLAPLQAQAKKAEAESNTQHLVNIPIFFITDRNREPCHDKAQYAKFGLLRQYTGVCNHDPHVGVAYCAIDNNRQKPLTQNLQDLGWMPANKHVEGAFSISLIEQCTYEEAKDKFYEDIYKKAGVGTERDIFVFAPGYMSTFESGLKEAARFAYYAERPVILYSWPSKGKFRAYSADEASIEWSQDHYNDMIAELSDIGKKDPATKIHLIAHSMGARLLLRAIPLIKEKNNFAEVAFVCPDVDDGVVKHYVRQCLSNDSKASIRMYMSHKDEMLKLSQLVHGGYARLGEEAGLSVAASPYKKTPQCASMILSPEAMKRFQTIDFTSMDEGTLGHKIPVHLMTSMSLTGHPPGEIEFEHKKKDHEDCSSLMLQISNLLEQDEASAGYFRVKVAGKKAPVIGAVKGKLPVLHTMFGKDWTMK